MKNTLFYIFSFIIFTLAFTSCEKERSTESGLFTTGTNSGTSIYSYVGAPNCTSPKVKGSYAAGVSVTIANTVTLQVNVQTPGTYLISTATINGITFKGSGTFSTTGIQNLNLLATGSPVAAGTFTYIPGTNGCTFEVVFNEGTVATSVYTFPDAPNVCSAITVNGSYIAGETLSAANTVNGIQVNVTKTGTWAVATLPNNGISFSGSGSFTTTGLQNIGLVASGTPITSGPFNYSPGNNGCSFTIAVSPANPLPVDYIRCKIDGVTTTFGYSVSASAINTPAQPPVPATFGLGITAGMAADSEEKIEMSLTKTTASIITGDIFDVNSLATGKIYLVSYTNASLLSWSAVSSIVYTPFTVKITGKTDTRIQGTFSGTISDTGAAGGNTKVITDGIFSLPVQ
ncbi:hypothetical protein QWZ08_18190 [Ferruginibacter paludis]|uniref:hypothetical protein n=1 Tax=Ferruginibacter paludis TaxID=1310417 RepID=UPI0025B44FD5|nr:hypothetical protein [Ferruginibacter paludis]MDN3657588.1 hypothetical protein [Ferruginibacter paludis]